MKKLSIALFAAGLLFSAAELRAVEIMYNALSVDQGLNYKADAKKAYGVITSLKLGEVQLAADLKSASVSGSSVQVVGVLTAFNWADSDVLNINAAVSLKTRQKIDSLMLAKPESLQVKIEFAVYDYDPNSKKMYAAVQSGNPVKGGVTILHGDVTNPGNKGLQLRVEANPLATVAGVQTYKLVLGVKPPSLEVQNINYQEHQGLKLVSTLEKWMR